jgi:hypothetical protein
VKDAEVERQHREHKADEARPEPDVRLDHDRENYPASPACAFFAA